MGLRRTAIALTTVLAWTLVAVPAVRDDVLAADRSRPSATHLASVKAEKRTPHLRGRVDLRTIGAGHGGPNERGSHGPVATDQPRLEMSQGVTGAPPTEFATANTTASPTLTKLGALPPVGNSFYASVEPKVAVGPDHVVRSDQLWFRVSNRTGGGTQTFAFADVLEQPSSVDAHEGSMWFIPSIGRWLALSTSFGGFLAGNQVCNLGFLDFAISDTANPLAAWTAYYYAYPNATVFRPRFGTSSDKFAFSVTVGGETPPAVCGAATSDGTDLTINEWSDVLGHTSFTSAYFFYPSADSSGTLIVPSFGNNPNTPNLEVLANHYEASPADGSDSLLEFSGPVPGIQVGESNLTLSDLFPAIGEALGPGVASEQVFRDQSAVLHDKRLVLVGTEACTPTGDTAARNCVRLIDLDVSGGPSGAVLRQDFYLASSGTDTYGAAVAFADTGDLVLTYERGSAGTGPSAYVVRQAPTDAANTVSAPRTLHASAGLSPTARPDGYVGAAPDPLVPDAVWVTDNAGSGSSAPYVTQTAMARTATGDTYSPIDPLRVLDTRDGTGLSGKFQTGVPRTFAVAGAGAGAIPADAVAITGNLTVTGQGSAGYVSVGPSVSANPATSTINFPLGDNRANNLTLPLDAAGKLMAVFKGGAGTSTQLILDVTGYFTADDAGATYKPLTAARVLDTRTGAGLSGKFATNVPRTFQVTGHGGVPAGATAVTGNLTVVGQTRAGYVSLTPDPVANPDTSTLNFPVGDTRANGLTLPLSAAGKASAVYKATTAGTTDLIFDVTGYYVAGTSGLRFFPLNPGRIMDSRTTALTQLTGAFSSSVPRTLVTGGHFGVPGDALAVTGNLTVVGQTKAGYVSITKDPTANPAVSTLNFPSGDVRANGTTVPLNAANDMALVYKATAGAKTHLILDLTGYFR